MDGFDRVTAVWEDYLGLAYQTNYAFDANGNLTSVLQNGSRQRTFAYDSLSRLLTSTNPESGTVTYTYDSNGNVLTRTRPLPNQTNPAVTVTTSYAYDALNRLFLTSYSDSTPSMCNFYDSDSWWPLQNIIGRMWASAMCSAGRSSINSAQTFNYDPMGRVIENDQCTPTNCTGTYWKPIYTYNLLGQVSTELGQTGLLTYSPYDGAGRSPGVTNSWVDSQHPAYLATVAAGVGYYPTGQLRAMTLGNGLTESNVYGSRLQPCNIDLNSSGTIQNGCADPIPSGFVQGFYYGFGTWGVTNNGNVTEWVAYGTQAFARSYNYDALNRLSSLSDSIDTTCPGLSWSFDPWGNRTAQTVTSGSCGSWSAGYDSNNHVNTLGYTYDALGNVTNDGNHTYFYDAENRIIQVGGTLGTWPNNCSAATACYIYNGDGARVEKIAGGVTTDYVRDLSGNVVTEFQNGIFSTGYVYFNGQLLVQYANGTTYFAHQDHLGSTRLLTGMTGCVAETLDYLPFGELISNGSATCTIGTTHKFTGQERDSESGNDNFGARYFGSSMGRFLSSDPSGIFLGNLGDPQQLNLYAYVRNNPINNTDPDGLDCTFLNSASGAIQDTNASENADECSFDGGFWTSGPVNQVSQNNDGTFQFGFSGTLPNGSIGVTTYNSYIGPNPGLATLSLAGQMATPGVNLATNLLTAFGYAVAAPVMAAAECLAGSPSCTKGNVAMALLPEIGALGEGATLLKEGATVGKGAELLQKGGGMEQALKDYESLQGVEQIDGSTRIKTLSSGTKVVLYESTGGFGRAHASNTRFRGPYANQDQVLSYGCFKRRNLDVGRERSHLVTESNGVSQLASNLRTSGEHSEHYYRRGGDRSFRNRNCARPDQSVG